MAAEMQREERIEEIRKQVCRLHSSGVLCYHRFDNSDKGFFHSRTGIGDGAGTSNCFAPVSGVERAKAKTGGKKSIFFSFFRLDVVGFHQLDNVFQVEDCTTQLMALQVRLYSSL